MAVNTILDQPHTGFHGLFGLVGTLYPYIVLLHLVDLPVDRPQRHTGGGIPRGMGQLGGRLFVQLLKLEVFGRFAGCRISHRFFRFDPLFGNFGLCPVRLCRSLFGPANRFAKNRVRPFLGSKLKTRFLIQTTGPPSIHQP